MKRVLIGLLIFIAVLLIGGVYLLSSTGVFRKIDNHFEGEVVKKIKIPGAEDITIDQEGGFAIISSDDRASRRAGNLKQGGLYYLDLKSTTLEPQLLTSDFKMPFYPHGISIIRLDSAHHKIYAINHVKSRHSIEVFHLYGDSLVSTESLTNDLMRSPNDLVALDEKRFFFTNDHGYTKGIGKIAEEQLALAISDVVYFDGKDYRIVAEGIAYANGINYDAEKNLLFVASPRHFLVKVYSVASNGDLGFIEDIKCQTGVDNIEFDKSGKIWIGCHPNLLAFMTYAIGQEEKAPSEIITIDYGGKGDYVVESIFLDDGSLVSASTVAAVFKNWILVGNVMDEHFLVLSK